MGDESLAVLGEERARVTAEMAAAARCVAVLEEAGLRIAFAPDFGRGRLVVELRHSSGELVRRLALSEVFDLIAFDLVELEAWVSVELGR